VRFPRRHHAAADPRRRFYARLIVFLLLVGYAIAFVLGNSKSVRVSFVFAHAYVSLIWLILLALAVGLLCGLLLPRLERRWSSRSHESSEPRDAV
jgi:uncharacterized integral membrane protein